MTENSGSVLKTLSNIQSLRTYLNSDVLIDSSGDKETLVTINVTNNAPISLNGGNVVFSGVGLRLIDSRSQEKGSNYWRSRINKTRTSDQDTLRKQFSEGNWSGGGESFPVVTPDENSHGEVLFPGESVRFEVNVSKNELPYFDIRVEGTISRRHLLHVSQPIDELKLLRKPLVIDMFRVIDKINFFEPLILIVSMIPEVGPQTTFSDVNNIKTQIEKGRMHLANTQTEWKNTHISAVYPELRDYRVQIAQYITSAGMAFDASQKALNSGDMEQIRRAVSEMKGKLLGAEEIKRKRSQIVTEFEITS